MRYLAAGWIAVLGLGACTEPGRQALGPTADTNCREVTPIAVDSVVDYGARPGPVTEFKMVSRSAPRFPKAVQSSNAMGYAVLSFVIDTGGSSSAARHASKRRPGGESSMTLSVIGCARRSSSPSDAVAARFVLLSGTWWSPSA